MINCSGKVFIVGAGIGGADYLTMKAHSLLARAEVLVYDALADRTLLNLVPKHCDRFDVGKRGGKDSMPQAQINQILVEQCQAGKQILRLKSGDPMIFGRVISEIKALHEAGCEFELVPGISSAIAAPMFAGIPLTGNGSSFTVLTGHDLDILPWQAIAEIPTLVILMGTANLSELIAKLSSRKSPTTPIGIIRWAGRVDQQIWIGTLADIQLKLPSHSLSPAVIVVGEVVKYHEWCMPQPTPTKSLAGKTILVTRAIAQSSQFSEMLINQGAEVIEMPTLAILPPDSWEELDQAIAEIYTYDWLILTSANAVDSFFNRLHFHQKDSRILHNLKIAVVGRKTADVLAQHGIIPDLIPPNFIAEALVDALTASSSLQGLKILFPRVQSGGREVLVTELEQRGAKVQAIAAYESGCPAAVDQIAWQALRDRKIDIITFASSKTVKHFYQLLCQVEPPEVWLNWLDSLQIASIGTQTSATCRELLGRMDIEATEFTLEGLVESLRNPT
jgi:uroporphyrinogen III methyltransferase / synthase